MSQIKVADISRWQYNIDWDTFKNQIQGVVIKATGSDGGLYTDSLFKRNQSEARRTGVPVWYYHYKGSGSAREQADYFLSAIGEIKPGEALVLDDENEGTINIPFICEFADRVKELTGLTIIIYSNQSRFRGIDLQPIKDRNIRAWSAKYGTNSGNPEGDPATAGGLTVIMWQYTSTARVPGVSQNSVDLNIFYGDVAAFKSYGDTKPVPVPQPAPAPQPVSTGTYTVVAGDTLSAIAAKFSYPGGYQRLATDNGIANPNVISVGQVLRIFGGSAGSVSQPTNGATYTVVRGDTLSGIGAKLGLKWQTIASNNGIVDPYIIQPGQVLKLLANGGAPAPGPATYTVVSGDYLSSIGAKLGKDWTAIAKLNSINAPYTIYPNQVLRLP